MKRALSEKKRARGVRRQAEGKGGEDLDKYEGKGEK